MREFQQARGKTAGKKMGKVMDGGGREGVKVAGTQASEEGR